MLERARQKKAIIYYDPNFRPSHKEEAIRLTPIIIENLEYADIVRGSKDDFLHMYGLTDADKTYKEKIKFYCPNFLCTAGAGQIALRTASVCKDYAVPPAETVSTIGAGDNFNAGVIYGLLKYGIRREHLNSLTEAQWDALVDCGTDFSAEVCKSVHNSVSGEFAELHRLG